MRLPLSGDYVAQLEREVSARGAESAALVQLVNVYGTEAEKRQVLADVSERQFAIAQRLAQAKETEAIIAASLSLRLQEEARNRGDNTEATRKEIEEAKKNALAKNTEAEQSKASAVSKRIETEATKANALAYQDNSARIYEFRAAAADAAREVERLTALQKVGKATDDQVTEARANPPNPLRSNFAASRHSGAGFDGIRRGERRGMKAACNFTLQNLTIQKLSS